MLSSGIVLASCAVAGLTGPDSGGSRIDGGPGNDRVDPSDDPAAGEDEPTAPVDTGETCAPGEVLSCTCPEVSAPGTRACLPDPSSPTGGYFDQACMGCPEPSCSDGVANGTETDIDCGGGVCAPCAAGKVCLSGGDCESGECGTYRACTGEPDAGAGDNDPGGPVDDPGGPVDDPGGPVDDPGGPVDDPGGPVDAGIENDPAQPSQCQSFMLSLGSSDACADCMCAADQCETEVTAVIGDMLAEDVASCAFETCTGECCVCGDSCGLLNYGDGPCVAEVERALGLEGGGLLNGLSVDSECRNSSGTSCNKALEMGDCEVQRCSAECGTVACN